MGVCSKHSLAKAGRFGQNVPFDERNRTRLVFSCFITFLQLSTIALLQFFSSIANSDFDYFLGFLNKPGVEFVIFP